MNLSNSPRTIDTADICDSHLRYIYNIYTGTYIHTLYIYMYISTSPTRLFQCADKFRGTARHLQNESTRRLIHQGEGAGGMRKHKYFPIYAVGCAVSNTSGKHYKMFTNQRVWALLRRAKSTDLTLKLRSFDDRRNHRKEGLSHTMSWNKPFRNSEGA